MFIPRPLRPFLLASLTLLFCACVHAQESLALVYPPPKALGTRNTFGSNQNVPIRWTSTWPEITLQIWQGPNNKGVTRHQDLLTSVPNTTSYIWSAHILDGFSNADPMHLYLFNPDNPDCDTCHSNSSNIFVQRVVGSNQNNQLKLGLGLGLGLGLPLLLIVTALMTWLLVRRRRGAVTRSREQEQEQPLTDWKHQSPEASPGGHTPQSRKAPLAEADGVNVAELAHDRAVVEAPAQSQMAELEGDPYRPNGHLPR